MIGKIIGITLALVSLLIIGYLVMIGIAPAAGNNDNIKENIINEKLLMENTNSEPAGTDTTGIQTNESKAVGQKLSGEVLTCTIYEVEKKIDLRLISLDTVDQSVNIYPSGTIIKLLPGTIMRVDLNLPIDVSGINIVSTNGDELKLQVPPCATPGGESHNSYSSIVFGTDVPTTSSPTQDGQVPPAQDGQVPPTQDGQVPPTQDGQVPPAQDGQVPPAQDGQVPPAQDGQAPPPVPELSTLALTGLGVFGLYIVSRSKQ